MVNYQNGKVYKIESLSGGVVYYGSTTQSLANRLAGHRAKKDTSSYEVLKFRDAKIYLVESCPCNNREELLKRVGHYIRNNECVNKKNHIPKNRKVECKCGGNHTKKNTKKHAKTKRHLEYMEFVRTGISTRQIECNCGTLYSVFEEHSHLNSKIHNEYIEKLNHDRLHNPCY